MTYCDKNVEIRYTRGLFCRAGRRLLLFLLWNNSLKIPSRFAILGKVRRGDRVHIVCLRSRPSMTSMRVCLTHLPKLHCFRRMSFGLQQSTWHHQQNLSNALHLRAQPHGNKTDVSCVMMRGVQNLGHIIKLSSHKTPAAQQENLQSSL